VPEHTEDVSIAAGTSAFGSSSGLELRNLSKISPDVAGALASHGGEYLLLDGLTSLSDEAASRLAEFSGNLSLESVTDLSAKAQRNLGAGKVKIVRVSCLRTLTDPMLAMKIGGVGQLETITSEVAGILARRFSWRREHIAFGWNPNQLGLGLSLKEITPDIAAALAKNIVRDGDLHLDSLQSMDAATASELAKCRGTLYLPGLKQLTPEVAAAFAEKPGFIFLESVEEIPVELAKVLANKKEGYISFTPNYGKKRETTLNLLNESAELLKGNERVKLPKQMQP
jgi:hypothetical protein